MMSDTQQNVAQYLTQHEQKTTLRFITCGSVDDGKSTLIGRLLYESKQLFDDQLTALDADSKRYSTQSGELDFALLVDGLAAEREQGITIDVAYRFFSTDKRQFIVADTPGHEQYTRNMVTGASTADLAVILIDARHGILTQTRRHSFLVSLLGIRRIVLAINKMDAVGYDEDVFRRMEAQYREFAQTIGLPSIQAIPMSALKGDNVVTPSPNMLWYDGPALMHWLDTVEVDEVGADGPLRFPVQWICRPNQDFRGAAGTLISGSVAVGDRLRVTSSGQEALVKAIVTHDANLQCAGRGQAVILVMDREVDISRGDMLASAQAPVEMADQFEAHIVWMADAPMLPERQYHLTIGTQTVNVVVTGIKYQLNVNTLEHVAAETLPLNGIGVCTIKTDRPIAFDAYRNSREMGGFILVDKMSYQTVGAGMLNFALRRSANIHWQSVLVSKKSRGAMKGQKPCVFWLTGLSGAGKSTIANALDRYLHARGLHTYILDGDNLRHGLNKDLGFTDADRVENIRRAAEVARLMVDAGLIVIAAFISPFRQERDTARALFEPGEFFEIFVDTPLAVAEQRDPKGLYKKARAGTLPNFTGIDSPYEAPEHPELRLFTLNLTPESAAEAIAQLLNES